MEPLSRTHYKSSKSGLEKRVVLGPFTPNMKYKGKVSGKAVLEEG